MLLPGVTRMNPRKQHLEKLQLWSSDPATLISPLQRVSLMCARCKMQSSRIRLIPTHAFSKVAAKITHRRKIIWTCRSPVEVVRSSYLVRNLIRCATTPRSIGSWRTSSHKARSSTSKQRRSSPDFGNLCSASACGLSKTDVIARNIRCLSHSRVCHGVSPFLSSSPSHHFVIRSSTD